MSISDELLQTVVSEYTREAGVRNLERELGTILRKTATRIASGKAEAPVPIELELVRDALGRQKVFQEAALRTAVPGVATGLAVTGTGGDVLFVEATSMEGKDGLVLTGQLGDVMKESARAAWTYARAHADTRTSWASTRRRSTTASSTSTSRRARSPRTARARGSRWRRR